MVTRTAAGTVAGLLAGVLLIGSAQLGAGFAFAGHVPDEWTTIRWGDHWAWRMVWGGVTTHLAGFIAGMIARRRPRLVGTLVAVPSMLVWGAIAWSGWFGRLPWSTSAFDVPMGYRIAATVLAFAAVPLSIIGANAGAPFGLANAAHFDARRRTLLGVRWYHYLWIPIPLNIIAGQSAWAAMYSVDWVKAAWRAGPSIFGFIPTMFVVGMLATLQLTGHGLWEAYQTLAGFESDAPPAGPSGGYRVLKYGIGFPLGAFAIQLAISLVQYGLSRVFGS